MLKTLAALGGVWLLLPLPQRHHAFQHGFDSAVTRPLADHVGVPALLDELEPRSGLTETRRASRSRLSGGKLAGQRQFRLGPACRIPSAYSADRDCGARDRLGGTREISAVNTVQA